MFDLGDVLFWSSCASLLGFMFGFSSGFRDGKREGFVRGKVAARKSVNA
jgi:hypothetical protein